MIYRAWSGTFGNSDKFKGTLYAFFNSAGVSCSLCMSPYGVPLLLQRVLPLR